MDISKGDQVVIGKDNWSGPSDCSATGEVKRVPDGLLVIVNVTDDKLVTGNDFLNSDGVEIYLDTRPYKFRGKNYYSKGVFKLNVVPELNEEGKLRVDYHPKTYATVVPLIEVSHGKMKYGYSVKVYFPNAGLRKNHYILRRKIGLDIGINDTDKDKRESQLMWHGTVNNWKDPSNFKILVIPR
ncbi:MAG: sugar-binding protein [Bacteroidota bacterium]